MYGSLCCLSAGSHGHYGKVWINSKEPICCITQANLVTEQWKMDIGGADRPTVAKTCWSSDLNDDNV